MDICKLCFVSYDCCLVCNDCWFGSAVWFSEWSTILSNIQKNVGCEYAEGGSGPIFFMLHLYFHSFQFIMSKIILLLFARLNVSLHSCSVFLHEKTSWSAAAVSHLIPHRVVFWTINCKSMAHVISTHSMLVFNQI